MPTTKDESRRELIRALNDAEAELKLQQSGRLIGFKWFRDTYLVSLGLPWAAEVAARQSAISLAIQDGLIRAAKHSDPREREFGTTSIKLNRADARVQAYLGLQERGAIRPPILGKSDA